MSRSSNSFAQTVMDQQKMLRSAEINNYSRAVGFGRVHFYDRPSFTPQRILKPVSNRKLLRSLRIFLS